MNRRAAIIDMLARHRSKGDEATRKQITNDLGKLSTGLLLQFLNEEQLAELRELERKG